MLALVYMVMAAQFERFVDPLVVTLIGIVVNNAIVLVDYINFKRREDGLSPREAALVAGRTRLRPILMTTSTTLLGLVPPAIGWGEGGGRQAALGARAGRRWLGVSARLRPQRS